MSKLNSILRDVGYASVGAAAAIVEGGGKIARALVRKGEKTLHDNQDTVDDLKRRPRDLGEKARSAAKKVASKPETTVDTMTAEERAELRRQLDEADQADAAAEAEYGMPAEEDAPAEDEPTAEDAPAEEAAEAPVAPDVIYHAAPNEYPEDPANG